MTSWQCIYYTIPTSLQYLRHDKLLMVLISPLTTLAMLPLPFLISLPLFTTLVRHGCMPDSIRNCALVPIPKGHKDPSENFNENYRPITLFLTLSKLLEWSILLQYSEFFVLVAYSLVFRSTCHSPLHWCDQKHHSSFHASWFPCLQLFP